MKSIQGICVRERAAEPPTGDARAFLLNFSVRAACRDEAVDPELFFPVGEHGAERARVERAKAVCARCPVEAECLAHALKAGEVGVWGGTTDEERQAIRQRNQPGHRPSGPERATGAAPEAEEDDTNPGRSCRCRRPRGRAAELAAYRKQRAGGLSQAVIAERLGMSLPALAKALERARKTGERV
jgi:WhiB family redox-sensing transcriptional regulator